MQIFVYGLAGLIIVASLLTVSVQRAFDAPTSMIPVQAQVDQYRMFMYVADVYMSTYTGGAGTVTWVMMKDATGAPSGAKLASMPATWKVVVAADNTWVACTPMDERAMGVIQQLAAPAGKLLNQTQIASQNYVVIGDAADVGKASQCSS